MTSYDPEINPLPIDIPMPTLHELARSVTQEPGPDVIDTIVAAALAARGDDNAYWIHAKVCQTRRDVTIGDVAWVLLNGDPR